MKKTINLLPSSVKHQRKMKKAKQSIVYVAVACAGSALGFSQYEAYLKNQITTFENKISSYNNQQSKVDSLEKSIQDTIEQTKSISSSSFPYHRFLYFISVNTPNDMRILSVQSISPTANITIGELGQTSLTVDATSQSSQPATSEQPTTPATTEQPAASVTTEQPATSATSDPNAQLLDSPVPGGESSSETDVTVGETETKQEASPFYFDTSEIYVRGYSISPESIAILADKIKQEDYVETVTVNKIRDYYTGFEHFKLFEMKITYQ